MQAPHAQQTWKSKGTYQVSYCFLISDATEREYQMLLKENPEGEPNATEGEPNF